MTAFSLNTLFSCSAKPKKGQENGCNIPSIKYYGYNCVCVLRECFFIIMINAVAVFLLCGKQEQLITCQIKVDFLSNKNSSFKFSLKILKVCEKKF